MGSLDGRVAIVTGGGTGIGRGIALAFAREGARVVVCGRRAEPLEETVALIREQNGDGLAVPADVSSEAGVEALVKTVLDAHGTVDILVNNAAIGRIGLLHEQSVQDWDDLMANNLRGPFLLSRTLLPLMRERRRGHILMISSDAGVDHIPGVGAYAVTKHALTAMAELMARENREHGVHVAAICPGWVPTDMNEWAPLDHDKALRPDDVADLALFIVSRDPRVKIGRAILIQPMENPWTE